MEVDWSNVLPSLVTVGAIMATWWRLDSKIERLDSKIERQDSKIERFDNKMERFDSKIERLDTKLSGEIKEVRLASEAAHKQIIGSLGEVRTTLAAHSERFNTVQTRIDCLEDKIDNIAAARS